MAKATRLTDPPPQLTKSGRLLPRGLKIGSGTPPPATLRGTRFNEEYAAAASLEPGQWMEWKDPPKSLKQVVKRWAEKSGMNLIGYLTIDGMGIVKHVSDGVEDDRE